jgi:type III pantothenate kinase
MLLAINVGNTHTQLGLADGSAWRARWRVSSATRRTVDECTVLVRGLFDAAGLTPAAVSAVVISSVVPALTPVFERLAATTFGVAALVVGPGVRTGMPVRYDPPAALGSDRLLDAVAARARFGAPVLVVDFGTATTFNVVDDSGTFVGGAIAPGVGIAAEALVNAGALLRPVDLTRDQAPPLIGRTTEDSVRSGVLYGYAGLVAGLLSRIDAVVATPGGGRGPVIATGGMAHVIAPMVPRIEQVVADLALEGLRLVHGLAGGGA